MAILNSDYIVKRPPDYISKLGISYQGMEDFYNPDKYNDGLYLLEKELENIELTDEKLHVVAEDKKLSEVLPTVARKGEILPQDIKGYGEHPSVPTITRGIVTSIKTSLNSNGNINFTYVSEKGAMDYGSVILSDTYAKKTDLKSLQTSNNKEIESLKAKDKLLEQKDVELQSAIDGIKQEISSVKQDIGGYAKRLETANNGIEARL